ncbi:MAG: PAS domain S-box protein [Desulfomonilia bacterium]
MKDSEKTKEQLIGDLKRMRVQARAIRKQQGSPGGQKETLKRRVEIFESMIEHCAVAIFAIDTHHRVIHWNSACEELTGIKAGDVIGTGRHWSAFYEHERPCLSDIIIDGDLSRLGELYKIHGQSVLLSHGLHAEGWYPRVGGKERYLIFDAAPIRTRDGDLLAVIETLQDITVLKRVEEEREHLNAELVEALKQIKTLKGLIPICAACKKIRDDKGYWKQLESYLEEHSEAIFSHGLCPDCFQQYFPEAAKARKE